MDFFIDWDAAIAAIIEHLVLIQNVYLGNYETF
jgi:hypothetical protein